MGFYFKFKVFGQVVAIRIGCKLKRFASYEEARAKKEYGWRIRDCSFCGGFHLHQYDGQRARVIQSQGGKCADCGEVRPLTKHHIKPRSQGGKTEQRNLVALCRPCHNKRHNADMMTKQQKRQIVRDFLISQHQLPPMSSEEFRQRMNAKWGRAHGVFGEKLADAMRQAEQEPQN